MVSCSYIKKFRRKVKEPKQIQNDENESINYTQSLSIITDSEVFDVDNLIPNELVSSVPSELAEHTFQDNLALWSNKKSTDDTISKLSKHPEAWSYIENDINSTYRSTFSNVDTFDPHVHELVLQSQCDDLQEKLNYKCIIRKKTEDVEGDRVVELSSGDMIHVDYIFKRVDGVIKSVDTFPTIPKTIVRSTGSLSALSTISNFEVPSMPVRPPKPKVTPSFFNSLVIAIDNIISNGNGKSDYCTRQLAIQNSIRNKFGDMSDIPLLF